VPDPRKNTKKKETGSGPRGVKKALPWMSDGKNRGMLAENSNRGSIKGGAQTRSTQPGEEEW